MPEIEVNGKIINTDDDPKIHSEILNQCSIENRTICFLGNYKGAHGLWTLDYNRWRKLANVHFYSTDGYYTGCYGDNNLKTVVKKGVIHTIWRRHFWNGGYGFNAI
jgi:hypothetical protein